MSGGSSESAAEAGGDWPAEAVDLVQAAADTKLLLSQRYAEWMLAGPALEDDIAGASAAQDEIGHVRQLFRLLARQGRDQDWLEGDREPEAFANVASLDEKPATWVELIVSADAAERAAWYLLDAIAHEDFDGLATRIGQDEYFHLEHLDGRLETLAADDAEALTDALESSLPPALALLGPASYDDEADPLVAAGFTDRSVADMRAAFRRTYEELLDGTDLSLSGVDWDAPDEDAWNAERRRVDGGGIDHETLSSLRGTANAEFRIE
ncbi:MAG TPA: Phenylacetic acid catabolic protein [Halobacteriales archaeon]|nr:Phenylacetic acid catabolic protein [Halobacteriales archaeon]